MTAFSAAPGHRFVQALEYDRIIDIASRPIADDPEHSQLMVGGEEGTGFFFPLPSRDGQDLAFREALVGRWRAERLARNDGVWYDGGDGESVEEAVAIRGLGRDDDIETSERIWLALWFGREGSEWQWTGRSHQQHAGHQLDRVTIRTGDRTLLVRYFDFTQPTVIPVD